VLRNSPLPDVRGALGGASPAVLRGPSPAGWRAVLRGPSPTGGRAVLRGPSPAGGRAVLRASSPARAVGPPRAWPPDDRVPQRAPSAAGVRVLRRGPSPVEFQVVCRGPSAAGLLPSPRGPCRVVPPARRAPPPGPPVRRSWLAPPYAGLPRPEALDLPVRPALAPSVLASLEVLGFPPLVPRPPGAPGPSATLTSLQHLPQHYALLKSSRYSDLHHGARRPPAPCSCDARVIQAPMGFSP
jgi:hypothetical protein